MEAYVDNSATTRVSMPCIELINKIMREDYGNPSSLHMKGVEAEEYILTARKQIARSLSIEEKEIIFTSCGTESDNMALIGIANAYKRDGMHIVTTKVEHAAILSTCKYLEDQGFEVTYLDVDKYGRVSVEDVKNAVRPDTILVSIMYVNNEVGAVMPIKEIAKVIKSVNSKTLLHVDAIQAYSKIDIRPHRDGIDLMSVSGHKINGPKGVGFLYVKDKTKIKPIIHGGGHQNGLRSGTENVPGVAALGLACELATKNIEGKREYLFGLRDRLIEGLSAIDGVIINSDVSHDNAPHILSVSVPGVRAEVLLHSLEDKKIYVSAGSACSSNKPAVSATLKAMGLDKARLESTVRISLSDENTKEEIEYVIDSFKELVPVLLKYQRR